MVVFLGKGSALWRGVVGLCPGCPEGGEWVEGASGTQHLSPVLGGAGYRVLPWSDPMIRVVGLWNPLLIWAGPGPPNLSYIHIRLIDEAVFQSLHRPFRCGRHTPLIENEPKSRLQVGYASSSGVFVCHSLVPNLYYNALGHPLVARHRVDARVLVPVEELVRPVDQPVQVVEWPSGR